MRSKNAEVERDRRISGCQPEEVDNAGLFIYAGHRPQKTGLFEVTARHRGNRDISFPCARIAHYGAIARSTRGPRGSIPLILAMRTFRMRERFCSYVPHDITPRYTPS